MIDTHDLAAEDGHDSADNDQECIVGQNQLSGILLRLLIFSGTDALSDNRD